MKTNYRKKPDICCANCKFVLRDWFVCNQYNSYEPNLSKLSDEY
jgi:hypothetical protein